MTIKRLQLTLSWSLVLIGSYSSSLTLERELLQALEASLRLALPYAESTLLLPITLLPICHTEISFLFFCTFIQTNLYDPVFYWDEIYNTVQIIIYWYTHALFSSDVWTDNLPPSMLVLFWVVASWMYVDALARRRMFVNEWVRRRVSRVGWERWSWWLRKLRTCLTGQGCMDLPTIARYIC